MWHEIDYIIHTKPLHTAIYLVMKIVELGWV